LPDCLQGSHEKCSGKIIQSEKENFKIHH
jgi:hypothetical protein